jgi:predicted signal transduction protein with EAL and GGDEF domain
VVHRVDLTGATPAPWTAAEVAGSRAVDRAITASLGVATHPDDAADGDMLVRQADRALYAAKAAGRNRVEVAVASDGDQAATMPGADEDMVPPQ